jgi:hypothetical protein
MKNTLGNCKITVRADLKELRKQKEVLVTLLHLYEGKEELSATEANDTLYGLIDLIDGIQDQAVDKCGLPKNEVFNL